MLGYEWKCCLNVTLFNGDRVVGPMTSTKLAIPVDPRLQSPLTTSRK